MRIIEEFLTLQGEGKYLGVPTYFIRTTGCNLRCAWKNSDGTITKCDTPYSSWNAEKGYDFNIGKFFRDNKRGTFKHVVITGGEPMLQHDIASIVKELQSKHYIVTIETNGTRFNKDIIGAFISISPKMATSYYATEKELKMHVANNKFMIPISQWLKSCHNDYQIKFVYNDKSDVDEILRLQNVLCIPSEKIYLMPQGITTKQFKDKQRELFIECKKNGWNYTPRMHIDIYGNIRGI